MDKPEIIGNGVPREVIYGFQLSEKEKADFDWMDDIDDQRFFRFKGQVYAFSEIMAVHNTVHNPNPPEWMKEFDGYSSDSFFSGILIKFGSNDFPDDADCVRVYTYYS